MTVSNIPLTDIMLRNYNEREDYAIRRMNEALRRFTQPDSPADGRVNAWLEGYIFSLADAAGQRMN